MSTQEGKEVEIACPWGSVRGLSWGNPSQPHILAIHGWLDNCNSFYFLGPALADVGYHVVAVDLPGHGLSDPLPVGLHYHDLENVQVVYRLIRHLGWSRYSLIGHSLGAGICLLYTSVFPEQVTTLTMLDMTFLPVRPGTPLSCPARLRSAVLGMARLEGNTRQARVYKTEEDAVQRLLQPPVYMKDREIQQTITDRSARILIKRGLKRVKDGFVFRRDLRLSTPLLDIPSWEDQLQLSQEVLHSIC